MPWLWTSRPCLGSQNPRIGRKQCSMLFFWEGSSELSLLSQQFLLWEAPRPFWVGERGLQGQNYFYNTTGYPVLLSHRCIEEFFRAAWCMMMFYSEHCSEVCVSQWANFIFQWPVYGISQVVLVVKNLPASAGDARDTGSIPESGRPPGVGNGNQLQCCCLGNSMDRGAWWATVQGVAKSQTRLSNQAGTCVQPVCDFMKPHMEKDPSKVQDKPTDFNRTEYKEFVGKFQIPLCYHPLRN